MNTTAAAPVPVRTPSSRTVVPARPSFLGILRGEWIKLLSLRSTWWSLAATVVLITGISLAVAYSLDAMAADPARSPGPATMNGAETVSGGFQLGMVTVAVLGALLITGEYSTGMIRSTLAAVPTRVPVLVAKAVAVAVLTVALSVLLLLPGVLSFISLDWVEKIVDYLPLPASGAFLGGGGDSLSSAGNGLTPTTGVLVIAAYALVPLAAGAVVLRRRDA